MDKELINKMLGDAKSSLEFHQKQLLEYKAKVEAYELLIEHNKIKERKINV
tara:strand:+ start:433 stop:585 length:153 start_codon:yes stop_codon:yes gene_type:complete